MKTLFPIVLLLFLMCCTEDISPVTEQHHTVLEISGNTWTEVKISGFGSVWVDGKKSVYIIVNNGVLKYSACGIDGEIDHNGKNKLYIECH